MTTPSAKRTREGFVFNLAFLAALSSADLRVDCPAPKRMKVAIKINGPNGQWKVMQVTSRENKKKKVKLRCLMAADRRKG